jgi:hypothetical protein
MANVRCFTTIREQDSIFLHDPSSFMYGLKMNRKAPVNLQDGAPKMAKRPEKSG